MARVPHSKGPPRIRQPALPFKTKGGKTIDEPIAYVDNRGVVHFPANPTSTRTFQKQLRTARAARLRDLRTTFGAENTSKVVEWAIACVKKMKREEHPATFLDLVESELLRRYPAKAK